MHDNPDVTRFVVRVDSFGMEGDPGVSPTVNEIEAVLAHGLLALPRLRDNYTICVEVEEQLA